MLPKSTSFTSAEIENIERRFWSKVAVKGPDDCWSWLSVKRAGYGRLQFKNKFWQAHRLSWVLVNGPIPRRLCVCHHCDNRACVNPAHLFLGTYQDNAIDAANKGRHKNPLFKGGKNAMAKLSANDVIEIRRRHANGEVQRTIAKDYPVSYKTISQICRRKRWRHIP